MARLLRLKGVTGPGEGGLGPGTEITKESAVGPTRGRGFGSPEP